MRLSSARHPPYPPYLRTLIIRTVLIWLMIQMMVAFAMLMGGHHDRMLGFRLVPTFGLPAILGWLDRKFAHEDLLYDNLGVPPFWFWTLFLAMSVALDGVAFIVQIR